MNSYGWTFADVGKTPHSSRLTKTVSRWGKLGGMLNNKIYILISLSIKVIDPSIIS